MKIETKFIIRNLINLTFLGLYMISIWFFSQWLWSGNPYMAKVMGFSSVIYLFVQGMIGLKKQKTKGA